MDENFNLILENESLRKEFSLRNLNLAEVFSASPDDLERENNVLKTFLTGCKNIPNVEIVKKWRQKDLNFLQLIHAYLRKMIDIFLRGG